MLFLQSLVPNQKEAAKDLEAALEKSTETMSSWFHLLLSDPGSAIKELGGWALQFVATFLAALLVFFVGRWLIRKLLKGIQKIFIKRDVDSSVSTFALSLLKVLFYLALALTVVGILGLKTTSFVAILAAAGFAVGMALSGTLQNFAGGVIILLLKPYRVGDYVTAQGQEGSVRSIQLFNTILTTPDNKTIFLPNGPVSTGIIMNTSRQNTRRVEWIFGINYGDDFDKARVVIRKILDGNEKILRSPAYTIEIKELADSAVNVVVRCWVKSSDYWDVFFSVNASVYNTLPAQGIQFPFPQMDIHITQ